MADEGVKLLAKAKASKAGWHRQELDSLYNAFGFIIDHKTKHDLVYHPDYPELVTILPRHAKIGEYNIDNAIKLIGRLQKLKEAQHG